MTIFLNEYVGMVLISNIETKIKIISCFINLCIITISYFHFKKIKKEKNITSDEEDGFEDVL